MTGKGKERRTIRGPVSFATRRGRWYQRRMPDLPPIRIANVSDNPDLSWAWLCDLMGADFNIAGRRLEWSSYTMAGDGKAPRYLGRWRGARRLAADSARAPYDLIVSHGPWISAWVEEIAGQKKRGARHLAFSFNFTDLPTGPRHWVMRRNFKNIDAFAVFTDAEQGLYADCFGIDRSKLTRAPWGVAPPLKSLQPRHIEGDYYAALGGEARDYGLLCEAARQCPDVRFVAVARPHNFDGLVAPANLEVRFNLPFEEAWGIVQHARAALVPLRSRETPCGLVTLVGGMHLGKAQIVTDAAGAADYLKDGETGLLVPAGDAARSYASAHCSEAHTVRFFGDLLGQWFGGK